MAHDLAGDSVGLDLGRIVGGSDAQLGPLEQWTRRSPGDRGAASDGAVPTPGLSTRQPQLVLQHHSSARSPTA